MGTGRTVPWMSPTEFLTRVRSFWKDLAKISQFWIFGPPQIHVGKVRLFVKIFSESTSVVSFEKWGREVVAMAFDHNEMIALCKDFSSSNFAPQNTLKTNSKPSVNGCYLSYIIPKYTLAVWLPLRFAKFRRKLVGNYDLGKDGLKYKVGPPGVTIYWILLWKKYAYMA